MDKIKHRTRKFKYDSKKELQAAIDKYFESREEDGKPATMSGLAYALGVSRMTLCVYSNSEHFGDIVERARDRVEMLMEEKLLTTGTPTAGLIFSLKNNYSWTDKQEVESKVEGVKFEFKRD